MNFFTKGNNAAVFAAFFLIVIFVIGVTSITREEITEGYAVPDIDTGLIQSPINIITENAVPVQRHIEAMYLPTHEEIIHKETTIEVEYDSGSYLLFNGVKYECNQFHFHTPSEHLIDGITFPMELHLVHTSMSGNDSGLQQYFVVSILFKMGKENHFIKSLEQDIPNQVGGKVERQDIHFNISELIEDDLNDYYHYTGSLTTPPYLETVHWAILEHIMEASPEQIARINILEGNNTRHIQSVNGRKIEIIHDPNRN